MLDAVMKTFPGILGTELGMTRERSDMVGGEVHLGPVVIPPDYPIVAGKGIEGAGIDIVDGVGKLVVVVLGDIRDMEMTGEDNLDTGLDKGVTDSIAVLDEGGLDKEVTAGEMGYQGMVHHGDDALAPTLRLDSLGTHPFEGGRGNDTIDTGIDAYHYQSGKGLSGIGQRGAFALAMSVIAVVGIEGGEGIVIDSGHRGGATAVKADGLVVRATVVVARNDEGLDACSTELVEFGEDSMVAVDLGILGEIACDEDELGLDIVLDMVYHLVEQGLAVVNQLAGLSEMGVPCTAGALEKRRGHDMGVREYDHGMVCMCLED